MRKPIDEVSDFIIMEIVKDNAIRGNSISSMPSREDVTIIVNKLLVWAKNNDKLITQTSMDITDLI